jgi:hypothetical protein
MFESDTNEELLDYIKSSEVFEDSKNVNELIYNNIQYFNGNISSTCYTLGPIKSETYGILEQLIRLNELGFITVKSYNGMKDPISCYNRCHTNKQRSYLRTLIKKSDFNKLQNLDHNEFIITIHPRKNKHLHYSNILNADLWIQICNCEHFYVKNIEQSNTDGFECFSKCSHIYNKLLEDYYDVSILDVKFSRPYFLFDKVIECLI